MKCNAMQEVHQLKLNPLAKAIRHHRALMHATVLAASATLASGGAVAQNTTGDELMLEEVLVTATKRVQSLQPRRGGYRHHYPAGQERTGDQRRR